MSNDGKHHFHLKEYSILQLLYAGILHIQVSELNTPSDGDGITGISAVFFNEMGNKKKKKWELKRRKPLRKLSQLDAFSFFKKFK